MINLSFISKIFEKLDLQQLVDCLNHNNLLCISQSEYRPHHSTRSDWKLPLDTIDHNIHLDRLNYLHGISGTCLSLFRSYLSNRRQSVAIANRILSTKELHYGVPQGSVLGPILFVLFIQPLSNLIKRHSLSVHVFADDIQFENSILPQHVHSAISSVKTLISDVIYWMIENRL